MCTLAASPATFLKSSRIIMVSHACPFMHFADIILMEQDAHRLYVTFVWYFFELYAVEILSIERLLLI